MGLYDTAYLLQQCKLYAQRPASDEQMTDARWYALLTEAQSTVVMELSKACPAHFYTAPVLLTSADSGKTYTFGTDADGDNIVPFGHVEVYAKENGRSLYANNYDALGGDSFVIEGDHIRMPGNRARTFGNGPYARFVAEPQIIDATHAVDSRLRPKAMRMLLVWDALTRWCQVGQLRDPRSYQESFARDLQAAHLTLATQYANQGTPSIGAEWWAAWWQSYNGQV